MPNPRPGNDINSGQPDGIDNRDHEGDFGEKFLRKIFLSRDIGMWEGSL